MRRDRLVGETWQEREQRRQRVVREAKTLQREPTSRAARLPLGLATVLWLGTPGWLVATLPGRVPIHWSFEDAADGWASRPVALTSAVVLPLVKPGQS